MPLIIEGVSASLLHTKFFESIIIPDPEIPAVSLIPEVIDLLAENINYQIPTLSTFGSISGSYKYAGGVLARNGKVYLCPCWNGSVRTINPLTKEIEVITILSNTTNGRWVGYVLGKGDIIYGIMSAASSQLEFNTTENTNYIRSSVAGDDKFVGGVHLGDKIFSAPYTYSQILEFNEVTNTFAYFGSFGTSIGKWAGTVLHPNGKIYGIPHNSAYILEINPENRQTRFIGNLAGANKWYGGVLAPNGKIYGVPYNSTSILEFDPATDTISTFGNLVGTTKYTGGVLAPNGRIYCTPCKASAVLEIDPVTKTTQLLGNLGTSDSKWVGGVLAPNGKIYCAPHNATTILEIDTKHISKNPTICTHSYFNKL